MNHTSELTIGANMFTTVRLSYCVVIHTNVFVKELIDMHVHLSAPLSEKIEDSVECEPSNFTRNSSDQKVNSFGTYLFKCAMNLILWC